MLELQQVTQETLASMSKYIYDGMKDGSLKKTIDVSTGLVGITLDAPAHQLVPLMSPFRQGIPRLIKPGATASQWRDITALSAPKLSVAENAASALFTTTVADRSAAYRGHGLRGQVTREAQAASQGFDDALSKETANCLLNYMKLEEQYILGGNVTALATPGAPTCAELNGEGSLADDTYYVRICALTLPAANRVTINRPADYGASTAAHAYLAGTAVAAIDVGTDGVTVCGAEGNAVLSGGGDAMKVTWTAVPGAAAYGVFVGLTTGAANLTCEAIVTQTSVTLTSLATGGVAGDHAGTSADALTYDGIIAQLHAGSAYALNYNDAMSVTAGDGEIGAIQDAFQQIWDNARVGKMRIVVSGLDSRLLTKLGVKSDALRITAMPSGEGRASLVIGSHVGQIMNSVTGDICPVETAPWLVGGTILFLPTEIPYNDSNVTVPFDMVFNYDVERWDYSSTTSTGPVWPFEVRSNGVLRSLFSGGCGIIYNIFKG